MTSTPTAKVDFGNLAAHVASGLGALKGYGHESTAAAKGLQYVLDELMNAYEAAKIPASPPKATSIASMHLGGWSFPDEAVDVSHLVVAEHGVQAKDLRIALDSIVTQIERWLEWDKEGHRAEGLKTDDDTHLMMLPVPFWPTHGMFRNWISALQAAIATMGDARSPDQTTAAPASNLRDDSRRFKSPFWGRSFDDVFQDSKRFGLPIPSITHADEAIAALGGASNCNDEEEAGQTAPTSASGISASPAKAAFEQSVVEETPHGELVVGAFYWVRIVSDPDTDEQWENDDMPARYAGGGNWNYLGMEEVSDWPVRWVGPRIQLDTSKRGPSSLTDEQRNKLAVSITLQGAFSIRDAFGVIDLIENRCAMSWKSGA